MIKVALHPVDPVTLKARAGSNALIGRLVKLKTQDLFCICFLFVSLTNCERPATISNASSPPPASEASPRKSTGPPKDEAGPVKFDVCGLLELNEIEGRIGSPIKESKGSENRSGNLRISQCVYVAAQLNKSVSLVVTQEDPLQGGKQSVRDFWHKRFDRYTEQSEEKEEAKRNSSKEEEEREGRPPRKVESLGDEAFWTAGSLYVLKKNAFLRLSVGGPDSEEVKLEHSKALAAIALKRL